MNGFAQTKTARFGDEHFEVSSTKPMRWDAGSTVIAGDAREIVAAEFGRPPLVFPRRSWILVEYIIDELVDGARKSMKLFFSARKLRWSFVTDSSGKRCLVVVDPSKESRYNRLALRLVYEGCAFQRNGSLSERNSGQMTALRVSNSFVPALSGVSPVTSIRETLWNAALAGESLGIARSMFPNQTLQAKLQWIDGDQAVLRFSHPRLGTVERAFSVESLPEGTVPNDTILVEVSFDSAGEVDGYVILPNQKPIKAALSDWQAVAEPELPADPDDPQEFDGYVRRLQEHVAEVTQKRAPEIARWLSSEPAR